MRRGNSTMSQNEKVKAGPMSVPRVARPLIALLLPLFCGVPSNALAQEQQPITSAAELVQAMHDRYADTWYRTLSFRQRVIRTAPDGTRAPDEIWYERAIVPGRLRIDFGESYSGSGVLFAGDTLHVFRDGERVQQRVERNPLLTLGFDVYGQPPQETLRQLQGEGFGLSRFHATTYRGRPAYVVGAEAGDTTSAQFWIDAADLLFVRLFQPTPQNPALISEITFEDYERLGGGWIAPLVIFRVNGRETMREEYYDIVADPALPAHVFDPVRWSEGGRPD